MTTALALENESTKQSESSTIGKKVSLKIRDQNSFLKISCTPISSKINDLIIMTLTASHIKIIEDFIKY